MLHFSFSGGGKLCFAPSCGKEIPDHSTFCLACGKGIQAAETPGASRAPTHSAPRNKAFSISGVIIILLLCVLGSMQLKSRHVHVGNDAGTIEPCQNIAQFLYMLGIDAAPVVVLIKALQPLVAYDRSC
jgi:hypothetical protein